jgi:Rieske 2Fe-2S family protein
MSGTASEERGDLQTLLARQPKQCSLLQEFYSDPEVFDRDLERVHMRHWLCVGHASQVARAGDWFRFDIARESLLIVRGRDDRVRALVNVCRHRGSHVCYEAEGHTRAFVCPYHGWTYDLDGRLRSARYMSHLDASDYGLHEIHARVLEGLVFVCFADDPPSLDAAESALAASLGRYGWADAKVAHRQRYSVDANWKLVTENYMECYHCRPAHPEFSRHHATEKPDDEVSALREEAAKRAKAMGIEIPVVAQWPAGLPGQESVECDHDATYPDAVTGSEDGRPLAPLMGDFSDYDGGFTYVDVGPASFYLAYPDHGVVYLFIPRATQTTDMEILWLVRADAQEGVDYDAEKLSWMWHVTSLADKRIIDHNQQGVNSRYYAPGPYAAMEAGTQAFVEWYLNEITPNENEQP